MREGLISIVMSTFNHEKHLAQAISSVEQQKLAPNLSLELIIVDDCSSDGSFKKARECANNSSMHVQCIKNPQNMGGSYTWCRSVKAARGRFVAWIEADDYWTNEDKLQSQIDFLESHSVDVAIGHNVAPFYDTDAESESVESGRLSYTRCSSIGLARGRRIPVTSLMIDRSKVDIDAICNRVMLGPRNQGDLTIALSLAAYRPIPVFDVSMSAYRQRNKRGESNYNSITSHYHKICDRLLLIERASEFFPDLFFGALTLKLVGSLAKGVINKAITPLDGLSLMVKLSLAFLSQSRAFFFDKKIDNK